MVLSQNQHTFLTEQQYQMTERFRNSCEWEDNQSQNKGFMSDSLDIPARGFFMLFKYLVSVMIAITEGDDHETYGQM